MDRENRENISRTFSAFTGMFVMSLFLLVVILLASLVTSSAEWAGITASFLGTIISAIGLFKSDKG